MATRWLKGLSLVAAAAYVFSPAVAGDWLWDDDTEITGNPALRSLRGLGDIWSGRAGADYLPLKSTLQWCQWHLWGDRVLGYHLTNIGLHLLAAMLLWRVCAKLGTTWAWFAGLLFVVHPLTVESVAWISELKNVLSLPLVLGAMIYWVDWEGRAGLPGPPGSPAFPAGLAVPPYLDHRYLLSLLLFLAAMLCKSSVVMFPCLILLYAWWRRRRISRSDIRASLPFFAVSLVLGLVTVWFQSHRAIAGEILPGGGAGGRLRLAGSAAMFYLGKSVWPARLIALYPRTQPGAVSGWAPWLVLAAAGIWLWRCRERPWGRTALLGAGAFLLTLVPVLGFVPMSYQSVAWTADHFAYLPLAGLIGLAAAGLQTAAEAGPEIRRTTAVAVFAGAAIVGLLAELSRRHAAVFRSEESLWTDVLRQNPKAWLAEDNLGVALAGSGRRDQAIDHYRAALLLRPDFPEAHYNLGLALAAAGHRPDALVQFQAAVRLLPADADAHFALAKTLSESGQPVAAIAEYREAVRLRPSLVPAYYNLGLLLVDAGQLPEAIAQYDQAIRLQPDYAAAFNNRGNALKLAGRVSEAQASFATAVRLDPANAEAQFNLGDALYRAGQTTEAIRHLEAGVQLRPEFPAGRYNLGIVLASVGRLPEAIAQYQATVRLRPGVFQARFALAGALAAAGRETEAIAEYQAALRLRPDSTEARRNLDRLLAGKN